MTFVCLSQFCRCELKEHSAENLSFERKKNTCRLDGGSEKFVARFFVEDGNCSQLGFTVDSNGDPESHENV